MTKSNTSRDVACPVCKAAVGKKCRTTLGSPKPMAHAERTNAWNTAKRKAREKLGPSKSRTIATKIARDAYWAGRALASENAKPRKKRVRRTKFLDRAREFIAATTLTPKLISKAEGRNHFGRYVYVLLDASRVSYVGRTRLGYHQRCGDHIYKPHDRIVIIPLEAVDETIDSDLEQATLAALEAAAVDVLEPACNIARVAAMRPVVDLWLELHADVFDKVRAL